MRSFFPLLLIVLTLLCFEVTTSLEFLNINLWGTKKTETGVKVKKDSGSEATDQIAMLDVKTINQKPTAKLTKPSSGESAAPLEEFNPNEGKKKLGSLRKKAPEETANADTSDKKTVEFIDLNEKKKSPSVASSSSSKSEKPVEFVDLSTTTETAKSKVKKIVKREKEEFIDLSSSSSSSEVKPEKAAAPSKAAAVATQKVEFVDLNGKEEAKADARPLAAPAKKAPVTQKVEFVDLSGAEAKAATSAAKPTQDVKKIDFIDLSSPKKPDTPAVSSSSAASSSSSSAKKVEFIDLNSGEAKPAIKKESTNPQKKVEFVDLNANSSQR